MKDTLVITATLGNRISLKTTVDSVAKIGGSRVTHVLIAPESKVEELALLYPNIEILAQPTKCKGIYPTLNFAIFNYIKKYKYVTYINDDDFWLDDFLILFSALDNNTPTQVAYGKVKFYIEKDGTFYEQACSSKYKFFKSLFYMDIILFTQQSTLMRSNVFLELNGYDENFKLIADTDFWIRAIDKNFKFKYLDKCCAVYTIQDNQLSSNTKLQKFEHDLLKSKVVKPKYLIILFSTLFFRFSNLILYSKRYFNKIIN